MTESHDERARSTSRLPGLHHQSLSERVARLAEVSGVGVDELGRLLDPDALTEAAADRLIENVVGRFALPFAIGANLVVNGHDRLVPMVVEEPSIVAGFSRVAKAIRQGGGLLAGADEAIAVAQIHITDMADDARAEAAIDKARPSLLAMADGCVPRLVARGGGARRLDVHWHDHDASGRRFLTVHVALDVVDAMGANLANTVAEGLAEPLLELTGGRLVMGILTNLCDERLARASCEITHRALAYAELAGHEVARRIEEGSQLAEADPYRAVTHNKGVMNGIDAAATALGQDVRALEAAAHTYASRGGAARPLSTFSNDAERGVLRAAIELPMAVSTVGPLKSAHPQVALAHELLGVERARELAGVLAAVGLVQSLAAVQALVTEGIQRGHMRLHGGKDGG